MKRTQYNLARLYGMQIKPGDIYPQLKRSIVINFLADGNYDLPVDKWHTVYIFKEKELNTALPDNMVEIHFIELSKLETMLKQGIVNDSEILAKWCLFMTAKTVEDMKIVAQQRLSSEGNRRPYQAPIKPFLRKFYKQNHSLDSLQQDPAILDAFKIVQEISKNEKERIKYEARQMFLRDQMSNQMEAEERGIEIGEKKGIEIGIIKTAKAMLAEGVNIEIVCKATGLTPQDLK
jgi:hypothetical protein